MGPHLTHGDTASGDSDQPRLAFCAQNGTLSWSPRGTELRQANRWVGTQQCPCLARPKWIRALCTGRMSRPHRALLCACCVPHTPIMNTHSSVPTTPGHCHQHHLCADKSIKPQHCEAACRSGRDRLKPRSICHFEAHQRCLCHSWVPEQHLSITPSQPGPPEPMQLNTSRGAASFPALGSHAMGVTPEGSHQPRSHGVLLPAQALLT